MPHPFLAPGAKKGTRTGGRTAYITRTGIKYDTGEEGRARELGLTGKQYYRVTPGDIQKYGSVQAAIEAQKTEGLRWQDVEYQGKLIRGYSWGGGGITKAEPERVIPGTQPAQITTMAGGGIAFHPFGKTREEKAASIASAKQLIREGKQSTIYGEKAPKPIFPGLGVREMEEKPIFPGLGYRRPEMGIKEGLLEGAEAYKRGAALGLRTRPAPATILPERRMSIAPAGGYTPTTMPPTSEFRRGEVGGIEEIKDVGLGIGIHYKPTGVTLLGTRGLTEMLSQKERREKHIGLEVSGKVKRYEALEHVSRRGQPTDIESISHQMRDHKQEFSESKIEALKTMTSGREYLEQLKADTEATATDTVILNGEEMSKAKALKLIKKSYTEHLKATQSIEKQEYIPSLVTSTPTGLTTKKETTHTFKDIKEAEGYMISQKEQAKREYQRYGIEREHHHYLTESPEAYASRFIEGAAIAGLITIGGGVLGAVPVTVGAVGTTMAGWGIGGVVGKKAGIEVTKATGSELAGLGADVATTIIGGGLATKGISLARGGLRAPTLRPIKYSGTTIGKIQYAPKYGIAGVKERTLVSLQTPGGATLYSGRIKTFMGEIGKKPRGITKVKLVKELESMRKGTVIGKPLRWFRGKMHKLPKEIKHEVSWGVVGGKVMEKAPALRTPTMIQEKGGRLARILTDKPKGVSLIVPTKTQYRVMKGIQTTATKIKLKPSRFKPKDIKLEEMSRVTGESIVGEKEMISRGIIRSAGYGEKGSVLRPTIRGRTQFISEAEAVTLPEAATRPPRAVYKVIHPQQGREGVSLGKHIPPKPYTLDTPISGALPQIARTEAPLITELEFMVSPAMQKTFKSLPGLGSRLESAAGVGMMPATAVRGITVPGLGAKTRQEIDFREGRTELRRQSLGELVEVSLRPRTYAPMAEYVKGAGKLPRVGEAVIPRTMKPRAATLVAPQVKLAPAITQKLDISLTTPTRPAIDIPSFKVGVPETPPIVPLFLPGLGGYGRRRPRKRKKHYEFHITHKLGKFLEPIKKKTKRR